jgi:DNA-binding MarR family transcriptional regulator
MSPHVSPEQSMGFAVKRLQQTMRSRMDAARAEHGLTSPQYAVLALLAEYPGSSNAELARRSHVAAPTMLRLVDTLARTGLITRDAPSPEQRVRRTVLTPEGRKRLAAASNYIRHVENLLVRRAEPAHVEIIMGWLHGCADELSASAGAGSAAPPATTDA